LLGITRNLYYVNIQFVTTCNYSSFATMFYSFYTSTHFFNFFYYFCDYGAIIKLYILPYWLTSLVFHPRINPYVHLVTNLVVTWLLFDVWLYILWALPQVWEITKEVSPKHFQLGIILGIKVSKCFEYFGPCEWNEFELFEIKF